MRTPGCRGFVWVVPVLAVLTLAPARPVNAQMWNWVNLDVLNCRLHGQIVDFTHNHGADRRICSSILGQPRDLYVYLPPNYDPHKAYPLILYLHFGYTDEHAFIGLPQLKQIDHMIASGEFPPAIIACPDGTIDGRNSTRSLHSGYMNGVHGRFEDHLIQEVVPFLQRTFPIRPERQAHAIVGCSAGGFAGLSIAIRYRSYFGSVATLAAAANGRYDNNEHDHLANFDPNDYQWRTDYDPDETAGRWYFGLRQVPNRKYMDPIFGSGPDVIARMTAVNPADLIFSTNLQPNELAIYLNYPSHDNWNFDAENESFAWLAAQRGIPVTVDRQCNGRHNYPYFTHNHKPAYAWLAQHLLGPTGCVGR